MKIIATIEGLIGIKRDLFIAAHLAPSELGHSERHLLLVYLGLSIVNNAWIVDINEMASISGYSCEEIIRICNRKREISFLAATTESVAPTAQWAKYQEACAHWVKES